MRRNTVPKQAKTISEPKMTQMYEISKGIRMMKVAYQNRHMFQ